MAAVFPCFHSNRLQKTQNGGIFAFKSKEQCLLPKTSKFDVLLKKLENSPAHCLNSYLVFVLHLSVWEKEQQTKELAVADAKRKAELMFHDL